jgi:acyl-CoA dehydrogenase
MSAVRDQMRDAARAIFARTPQWQTLSDAGFPLLLVPEAQGGIGGDWGDAVAVLNEAGAAALAQPLGEAMLANWLIARTGQPLPSGLLTIGSGGGRLNNGRFTGYVAAVPWGRSANHILATINPEGDKPQLILLPPGKVTEGESPAGEPRDRLDYQDVPAQLLGGADHLLFGAFMRAAQTAGALGAALALCISHVENRVQFGKTLSKQQAVQQSLALLAEEVAAATMATAAAAAALDAGMDRGLGAMEMMAARLRANMAIHRGVALAHQVHGAVGFTADYALHRYTRRLMGWRSDFGGDNWAELLGAAVLGSPGAALWTDLTARSDL